MAVIWKINLIFHRALPLAELIFMVVGLARLLVKLRLAFLAGFFVTAISYLFGKKSRIWYNRNGYWVHNSHGIILNNIHPDFRHNILKQFKQVEEDYLFDYIPKEGDVCVDAGAGLGIETIYLARVTGSSGRVYAIEASPRIFQMLKASVENNNLNQVKCFQLAISNSSGPIRISADQSNYLINNIFNDTGDWVDSITMDDFIEKNNIGHIDYMKVNIEGAEGLLIREFRHIIRVKHIAISCHDFLGKRTGQMQFYTKQAVTDFLMKNNFTVNTRNTGIDYLDDWVFGINKTV